MIRWNHPGHGLVYPSEFIGIAESTGLIVPIGNWVLNEACHQAQSWLLAGTVADDFYVSVNLSPRQLAEPSLVGDVARAFRDSGLPPRALVLEITESTLMLDFDAGLARLRSLKELGLRVALDDYGTGYSSLSRLGRLPVDIVKIDKSFIDQLTVGREGRALVQSIIEVAKAFAMRSIAEGVERPDQRDALDELGCDYIQGYLFAKPTPPAETADTLRRLAPHTRRVNDAADPGMPRQRRGPDSRGDQPAQRPIERFPRTATASPDRQLPVSVIGPALAPSHVMLPVIVAWARSVSRRASRRLRPGCDTRVSAVASGSAAGARVAHLAASTPSLVDEKSGIRGGRHRIGVPHLARRGRPAHGLRHRRPSCARHASRSTPRSPKAARSLLGKKAAAAAYPPDEHRQRAAPTKPRCVAFFISCHRGRAIDMARADPT